LEWGGGDLKPNIDIVCVSTKLDNEL